MSVHGYPAYRPTPKGREILRASFQILSQYEAWESPMTVRQVFYRLIAGYKYGKTEKNYQALINYISRSRRAFQGGLLAHIYEDQMNYKEASEAVLAEGWMIPFSWIRDEKGSTGEPLMFENHNEFVEWSKENAAEMILQRQEGQPQVIEVWCEANGMYPLMREISAPYGVRVSSGGGYDSVTAKHNLAQRIVKRSLGSNGERPTVVLHIGDFDPSGEGMYETLRDDVSQMVVEHGVARSMVTIKRVALTEEQVIDMNAETAPPKEKDSRRPAFVERHPDAVAFFGSEDITVQLEALTPPELRELIERQLEEYIDRDAYDELIEREETTQEDLVEAFSTLEFTDQDE